MADILESKWSIWYHLPNDTNWSINSYTNLFDYNTVQKCVGLNSLICDKLLLSCMFFIMKDDIAPVWEAPENMNGGCFSFKIQNIHVPGIWKSLVYSIAGNTLFTNDDAMNSVNGITISPKKFFCIIKVWMNTDKFCDTALFDNNIIKFTECCIFKKHT
jgi:hypothetical protein